MIIHCGKVPRKNVFRVLQKEGSVMKKWTQEDERDAIAIILIIRNLLLLLKKGGVKSVELFEKVKEIKNKFGIECNGVYADYSEALLEYRKVEEENNLVELVPDESSTKEKALNETLRLLGSRDFQKTNFNKRIFTPVVKISQSLNVFSLENAF